jgi:hypothetical protein
VIRRIGDSFAVVPDVPGRCDWIISGVHGEESSGPIAVNELLPLLPPDFVVVPNASFRQLITHERFGLPGTVVGKDRWMADFRALAEDYPPKVVVDLHEDDESPAGMYLYLHSQRPTRRAHDLLLAMEACGYEVQWNEWRTRDNEPVVSGIVVNSKDDSVDDLLCGLGGEVYVLETPASHWPLEKRVLAARTFVTLVLNPK